MTKILIWNPLVSVLTICIALETHLNRTTLKDTIGCLNASQLFKLDFQASKKFTKHILHKAFNDIMTGEYEIASLPRSKTYMSLYWSDYAEEQANEIEALESIYPDEFQGNYRIKIFNTSCSLYSNLYLAISEKEFKIAVYPEEQDEENPRKHRQTASFSSRC